MEQINKVELVGIVGSANTQTVGGRRTTRFSVVTKRAYKDAMGEAKIEETWHNVNVWHGKACPDPSILQKGARVQVFGRIRNTRVQNEGQPDRTYSEIQAREVRLVTSKEDLVAEMD